jgi:hypothetical protein
MTFNTYLIISVVIAIIAVALGVAYQTGALNPIIEKIGVYYFKAEGKAEEKKMEAQGMKEGEDFLKSEFDPYTFCDRNVVGSNARVFGFEREFADGTMASPS